MLIDLIADSSVSSAPTGFMAAMQQAATILDDTFSNAITLNITVGWGEVSGSSIPATKVEAEGGPTSGTSVAYSSLLADLGKSTNSTYAEQALASLPATAPGGYTSNGTTYYYVSSAQEKALGLESATSTAVDGGIGFSTGWTDPTEWVGAALHELTHAMGRIFDNGQDIMDLYRYSAPGVRATVGGSAAYFSINNGVTDLGDYGTTSDYGDYNNGSLTTNDPFNEKVGNLNALTTLDLEQMNVLGFNTFNALDYIASYTDLMVAFGTNVGAATNHYDTSGIAEGRKITFNGLDYIASYGDLIKAFGANEQAGATHFITSGSAEGRKVTFSGLDYIASYADLIKAFGANEQAGATHYINSGYSEGRKTTFNGLDYIASYSDLITSLGTSDAAGATSYITSGYTAGRSTSFDGLDYIASYVDLIKAFGANEQAGAVHYISHGYSEGRRSTFDGLSYIAQYTDLMKAFGANNDAGANHYISHGYGEGRSAAFNVTAYESQHTDLIGKYANNDAFLTAYINTYDTTGHLLT